MNEGDQEHLETPSHLPFILASSLLKHTSMDSESQKFGRSLLGYLVQLSIQDGTDYSCGSQKSRRAF